MVDAYQTGEPIPDGYLHIQLINPVNPWVDYEELRDLHGNYDLEAEHNARFYFKETLGQRWDPQGITVKFTDHTEFYPYSNIHNVTLMHNSDAYLEALHDWQLSHEHTWRPHVDLETQENFRYCEGCRTTDRDLEVLKQERIDRARGLTR